ncbi:galactitol-1-phosphate 5-dehydrogenase [Halobacillus karajensis]|uniref:Galactitol-1-phosphate 5-dehydrogenase n=1 Tax=Halobacillus karajensis TaxID=195088 RepID=A0A024P5B9_9BACI|nr:galactitol-1-phosphate 5-dehydrogenase [Halobacillus karajensis]CDQ20684.1 Galactitol-1-phosphate 5-dehydrogenase [Halobacillus karajensis]CDQ23846.1 Galactitol-1-phosphate 5-dehydrogenase [Halobacillus karajensis]CDQ27324.1 Galactitol-1-phosphate 5-dehydrogenase [Halobacillus karajensis]
MKTLNLYGTQDLRYEERPNPVMTGENEVVIKVMAVGICGSDVSRYKKLGPYIEGMTFGHEFSGEVVETGLKVDQINVGDRVAGCPTFYCGKCHSCLKGNISQCEKLTLIGARHPGAYAEFVRLPATHVLPLPDNVNYEAAAMVEPSSVVAHGFYRTSLQPGSTVAIMGCGSIGLLAVQWAKIFGAKQVIAIDIDDQKLEIAEEIGADVLINPTVHSPYKRVAEATDKLGADLAVECAGSPITSEQILALPKKGGEVLYMGIPYANVDIERFYFERIVRNELRVIGSWNAISAPFPGKEWESTLHYMSRGQLNIQPLISHRLSLKEGPAMFENLINQNGSFIKVMFYPHHTI